MSISTIDFSAQFGGRDAAAAALPHFKALKMAASGIHLEGFPFQKLAFILRVDGEVNQYDLSGLGNVDVEPNREYLSLDIGVRVDDRHHIFDVISTAIHTSAEEISKLQDANSWDVDVKGLQNNLEVLCDRYKKELGNQLGS